MQLNNLTTKFLARKNYYYEKIDSTQSEIWRKYKQNLENGTLIMAGVQTDGKGTHGRTWYTEEKNNIAFSFYVEMNCNVSRLDGLTIEIAELILEIFKEKYNVTLSIKKPNDIVHSDKKIGGILTETKLSGENVNALVVGIGMNTSEEVFSDKIKSIATSIKNEFNIDVNNEEIISEFCNRFEKKLIERIEN